MRMGIVKYRTEEFLQTMCEFKLTRCCSIQSINSANKVTFSQVSLFWNSPTNTASIPQ